MKSIKIFFFFGWIMWMLCSSCTPQKRLYSHGYHFEWFERYGPKIKGENIRYRPVKKTSKIKSDQPLKSFSKDSFLATYSYTQSRISNIYQPTENITGIASYKLSAKPNMFIKLQNLSKHPEQGQSYGLKKKQLSFPLEEYPDEDKNSDSLAGFIFSLVSVILFFANAPLFAILLALIGFFFSIKGLLQQIRHPETGKIIFGFLGLIISGTFLYITYLVLSIAIPALLAINKFLLLLLVLGVLGLILKEFIG